MFAIFFILKIHIFEFYRRRSFQYFIQLGDTRLLAWISKRIFSPLGSYLWLMGAKQSLYSFFTFFFAKIENSFCVIDGIIFDAS